MVEPRHHPLNPLRKFRGELVEIMENRRQAYGQKDAHDKGYGGYKKKDGSGLGGSAAAKVGHHDASDDRHQNGGEQGADVDDDDLFHQQPGKAESQQKSKGEEDVSAYDAAGLLLVRGEIGRLRQLFLLWSDATALDADSLPLEG
jgi:hypothetical protein